jgi:predicted DNA binding CopG/RHH family protein
MPKGVPKIPLQVKKKTQSISFELSVLDAVKTAAANESLPLSVFVNRAIKRELKLIAQPKE